MSPLLKAYEASGIKGFILYEWFDCLDRLECTELPPYKAYYIKLKKKNNSLPKKSFNDYQKLANGKFDEQYELKKLRV